MVDLSSSVGEIFRVWSQKLVSGGCQISSRSGSILVTGDEKVCQRPSKECRQSVMRLDLMKYKKLKSDGIHGNCRKLQFFNSVAQRTFGSSGTSSGHNPSVGTRHKISSSQETSRSPVETTKPSPAATKQRERPRYAHHPSRLPVCRVCDICRPTVPNIVPRDGNLFVPAS